MNYNKSEALPSGDSGDWVAPASFPFRWSTRGFTYLGIRVPADIKELYKLNIKATLISARNHLHRWFLPLSWIGWISLIKINVLPRILYAMQVLPLEINRKVILDIKWFLSKFTQRGKKSRLKMKNVQLPIDRGGKALPNFLYFNQAYHARIRIKLSLQGVFLMTGIQRNWEDLSYLFKDGNFMSFENTQNKYIIPHNQIFSFFSKW